MISLSNPMWKDCFESLMHYVIFALGLDRSDVGHTLEKVVLEDIGDSMPTAIHKSEANRIGSLEIQLPSIFSGGAHTFMHDEMKSFFTMGADDSSCHFESWFLAGYANCVRKSQAVTDGCRLVMVFSLIWKGTGPAPGAPTMAAVKQLVPTLRKSTGCAGLYLHKARPDDLIRHGFSSLIEPRDRKLMGLLQAASAHMAQGKETDSLVLHICTASLIEMCFYDVGPAALDLKRRIYCPDRSEPSTAAHAILSAFRFPEDMLPVDAAELAESTLRADYDKVEDDGIYYINKQGIDVRRCWWTSSELALNRELCYEYQVSAASTRTTLLWGSRWLELSRGAFRALRLKFMRRLTRARRSRSSITRHTS